MAALIRTVKSWFKSTPRTCEKVLFATVRAENGQLVIEPPTEI